jgi:hypothetical protein
MLEGFCNRSKINVVDNNGVDSIWKNVMLTSSYLVSFVTFKLTSQILLKTKPMMFEVGIMKISIIVMLMFT